MKDTKIGYAVIGGQYVLHGYNEKPIKTLLGAKRIASRNMEYHDNWRGWQYPSIYRWEDTELVQDVYNEYCMTRVPKFGAEPVATREYGDKWQTWL